MNEYNRKSTASTDTFLPRNRLLKVTRDFSSEESKTSGWKNANGASSVVGYFVADNGSGAASAGLLVEQSIDGEEVDISGTISPGAEGSANPFELALIGNKVKITVLANEDAKIRLIAYRSTRVREIVGSGLS